MPMMIGNTATTASSSRLRRRRKTWRSSDKKKRSQARAGPTAGRPSVRPRATDPGPAREDSADWPDLTVGASAIDVVPLSGEPDEQLLQAG